MGYHQSIIVSSPLDEVTKAQVIQGAQSHWPFLRKPQRYSAYSNRLLRAPPELTTYLFGNGADYEAAVEQTGRVEEELANWSKGFPAVTFAYLEAECFGGTCAYSGVTCRAGEVLQELSAARDAHIHLLQQVGIATTGEFEPFRRGFFQQPGVTRKSGD